VLTPQETYSFSQIKTPTHNPAANNSLIFNNSNAEFIVTLTTKTWVSELIDMPTHKIYQKTQLL